MQNTALPHQKPEATIIVSRDGGYSVRNGDLEVTVAVDSQAHELAKAIHHLEGWLQNR